MCRRIVLVLVCSIGSFALTAHVFAKTTPAPIPLPIPIVEIDSDQDGLSDRLEIAFKTDPNNADADSDGYTDGQEVAAGYSPTSSSTTPLERSIVIRLSTQRMEQVLGGVKMAEYVVSTGKPGMRTPVGTFHVLSKNPRAWSRMAKLWMPWWMEFSVKGYGIHELPEWPNGYKEGANHLGKPVSHG
jgi:hypothetical protein